jgi:poly-gamma-glutamate synthesis protein (capsule biosynthesis protein)
VNGPGISRAAARLAFAAWLGLCSSACGVSDSRQAEAGPADIPAAGPITIALAGDATLVSPIAEDDRRVRALFDLIRGSTLGFVNLETALLDAASAARVSSLSAPHWFFARPPLATELRRKGFDAVSIANNHAMDFGAEGLASTAQALTAAGFGVAGGGSDLDAARKAWTAGSAARGVAFVAVTTSAEPAARASVRQPDIAGRPGVSTLQFTATVTVDPATYETLKQSVVDLQAGPAPGDRELTMFGTRIVRGDRIQVDFAVDATDRDAILDVVRAARRSSELVVVSVHSHEPFNASEAPASFLETFAHDLVDAGAQIVFGHGPHRMRGADVYNGAVIFYSLGNFIFQTDGLDFRAADPFDAGQNLYGLALGTTQDRPADQLGQDWWWEGLAAIATVDHGALQTVRVYPVDLAGDGTVPRGIPRLAEGERAPAILRRFSNLLGRETARWRTVEGGAALERPIP